VDKHIHLHRVHKTEGEEVMVNVKSKVVPLLSIEALWVRGSIALKDKIARRIS
jgi:hypothetical protein